MNLGPSIPISGALLETIVYELLGEFSHSLCQRECNDPYAALTLVGRDNPYVRIRMADIFRPENEPLTLPSYVPNPKKRTPRLSDKATGQSVQLITAPRLNVWQIVWRVREQFLELYRNTASNSASSVIPPKPGEQPRTRQEIIAAQLLACNGALIMLLGGDASLAPMNEVGLSGGLLQESHLLTQILPEAEWSESGKRLLQRAWKYRYRDLTQGVVTPPDDLVRPPGKCIGGEVSERAEVRRDLNDPLRLLFYLTIPEYHSLLYFDGMENRHEYVLVCFKGSLGAKRLMILDTHVKENAAFAFFASPEAIRELLAARTTKLELRSSPLFLPPAIIHDPDNRWHKTVRAFLAPHAA